MSSAIELAVPSALEFVLPAEITKVAQYFGSFVRLECTSTSGASFEVRVYLADWVFFAGDQERADSSGAAAENNAELARLVGERLQQVVVRSAHELWLVFTGSLALRLRANHDEYEPADELLIASLDLAYLKFSPTKGFVTAPSVRTEH